MPAIEVGSQRLWYDERGHGQPLILIPGLGASRLSWAGQVEGLSQHFRVLTIDNRDAGDSALAAGQYTIADLADDVARLVTQLQLSQVNVMGWSMGGAIAQEVIDRHPAIVSRLALIATTAGGRAHVPPAPSIGALLMRSDTESVEARVRRTYPHLTAPGYMEAHPADLDFIVYAQQIKEMSTASYRRQLTAMLGWPGLGDRLSRIAVPTLIIHGNQDPLIPYPNGQYLAAHIRGAELLTYDGVGHLPPIEAKDRFRDDVVAFFAERRIHA
jgi:3-oxoadipate enol-lactonase